ncbi:hypothetical protein KUV50_17130 [Membranicola marinus]|uniref:Uncharacterized protein n=1 Tax=Membranihabitans marinus TaxID=1227546 RepID=A0A953I017_9BACT|nr:hypothetical protein [Membranihabitans marinus]MBY5959881.1 hypothetical protein [Membranihabitans marinus]
MAVRQVQMHGGMTEYSRIATQTKDGKSIFDEDKLMKPRLSRGKRFGEPWMSVPTCPRLGCERALSRG